MSKIEEGIPEGAALESIKRIFLTDAEAKEAKKLNDEKLAEKLPGEVKIYASRLEKIKLERKNKLKRVK